MSTTKSPLSVTLNFEKKQIFEYFAKEQNSSPNFVILAIDKKEDTEYQNYIKNRVMRAYQDMIENGSQGVTSRKAKEIVMQKVREKFKNNQ